MRRPGSPLAAAAFLMMVGASACATILGIDEVPSPSVSADGGDASSGGDDGGGGGGACAAKLDTDGHNCGRCGHDCLGGNCRAGRCAPVLLVSAASLGADRVIGLERPIVDDDGHLAWKDLPLRDSAAPAARIRTCSLPACRLSPPSDVASVGAFGLAGGRLYFEGSDYQSLRSCAVAGCTGVTTLGSPFPAGTAVELKAVQPASQSLLFEVYDSSDPRYELRFCRLPDCRDEVRILATGSSLSLAQTDGTYVYFSERSGGVTRCPVSGCVEDGGDGIVIDRTMVPQAFAANHLVGTRNGHEIVTCELPDGAGSKTIVDTPSDPSKALMTLTADESFVYWFSADNILRRCPLSGCTADVPPEVLFAGPPPRTCAGCESKALTRDSVSLIWTSLDAIYRLALP